MIVITDGFGKTQADQIEAMTLQRNALLASSDWTQTLDAPVDREAWATYRQQLRDFPSTWTPSETAEFPDPPA